MRKSVLDKKKINQIIEEASKDYEYREAALIPILHRLEEEKGYLPEEALNLVSKALKVPLSKIYGVATFYTRFHLKPTGEHIIRVCQGTACHLKGSEEILRALQNELKATNQNPKFTLEIVHCFGCCNLSPVISVDEEIYGKMTLKKLKDVLKKYEKG